MRGIKRILDILGGLIYVCIISCLLIAAPMIAGYRPVVVLSGSMEPVYKVGSVIYYKAQPFEKIEVGDAITFRGIGGDVLVTHRVVEKHPESWTFETQGDANGSRDPAQVSYQQVVGKASSFCIPYAGYFINYVKQPLAIFVMTLILLAGMATDYFVKKGKRDAAV